MIDTNIQLIVLRMYAASYQPEYFSYFFVFLPARRRRRVSVRPSARPSVCRKSVFYWNG